MRSPHGNSSVLGKRWETRRSAAALRRCTRCSTLRASTLGTDRPPTAWPLLPFLFSLTLLCCKKTVCFATVLDCCGLHWRTGRRSPSGATTRTCARRAPMRASLRAACTPALGAASRPELIRLRSCHGSHSLTLWQRRSSDAPQVHRIMPRSYGSGRHFRRYMPTRGPSRLACALSARYGATRPQLTSGAARGLRCTSTSSRIFFALSQA